jgi:pectin methylesterase-like acyl-CoA thioesterase
MRSILRGTLAAVMIVFSSAGLAKAQNVPSVATWPCSTDASVQISGAISGLPEAITGNLVYGSYAAPGTNFYTQRIKMATWPTNQLTQLDSVYIQYQVAPQTNYTLHVDSIVLSLGAVSTQDMMANLYYSTDPTFATKTQISYTTSVAARVGKPAGVFLSSSKLDTISAATNVDVNQGDSLYFRIYPWVDSSGSVSGKYVAPQNVTIYATAIPVPVSAGAVWPLMSDENAQVTGLINAGSLTYGGGLKKYGFNTNGDRWTTQDGSWPLETGPNFTRFAQFAITPQTGGTFYAKNLAFSHVVEFTNNLRVAIYYSNDPTFATKTFVADTTVPSTKTTYNYTIADTVNTGDTLYVRFFPYDTKAESAWKLEDVDSVSVTGATTGLAILPPTVATTLPSYVSTTFFTTGGNVSADGGGTVTARGVCFSETGIPTVSDGHTSDGTGIGGFVSTVTGLNPATKYYVRAYATNIGGTSYGVEDSVTTLAAVVPPTLSTATVTNILATTATAGGAVSDWGGDSVTARGVCWGPSADPTTSGNKTVDGSGIGSFTSGLTGLTQGTMYHVRAYAVNAAGTGYGPDSTFTTQFAKPDTTVVVAQDGSGNYTTVQAAFNAVPLNYTGKWTIYVKNGLYHEKDTLAAGKSNVILLGENRDSTVIWNDDYGDKYGPSNPGTSGSFTVTINSNDFIAKNITIQNTYSPQTGVSGTQAVALEVNGDRQEYINCKLLGFQDTYYTRGSSGTGRVWMKNCFIEGSVDFIFGRDIVVFDSCTIHEIRNGGTLTAASTDPTSAYGYVFRNSTILADSIGYDSNPIVSFYLGRPWQGSPRTVFIKCSEPANLDSTGWLAWNVAPGLYAENSCFGPGSGSAHRVNWSSQLTDSMAALYTLKNIFAKNSASSNLILADWMPPDATPLDNSPFPDTTYSVTVTSFNSSLNPGAVTLNWQTSAEVNNAGFNVLRKASTESNYTQIASYLSEPQLVGGGPGTTSSPKSYSFTDSAVVKGATYSYELQSVSIYGVTKEFSALNVTGVAEGPAVPKHFALLQNYPNPFNPTTTITYDVPFSSRVTIDVYDVLGSKVETLVNETKSAGEYRVSFNGSRYASGVYFYRMVAVSPNGKDFRSIKKLVLLK